MKVIHKISGIASVVCLFLAWGIVGNIDCGGNNFFELIIMTAMAVLFGVAYIVSREDDSDVE